MNMLDYLVLALFPPIFLFACVAVWVFWADYILPAWRDGVLSVREHKLPIALGFLVLGLAGETLMYGIARYLPGDYMAISQMMWLVGLNKLMYFIGLIFAVAWAIKMRTHLSYLGGVLAAAGGLWLLSLLAVVLLK